MFVNMVKHASFKLLSFFCLIIFFASHFINAMDSELMEVIGEQHAFVRVIETTRTVIKPVSLDDINDWYNETEACENFSCFWEMGEEINVVKERFEKGYLPRLRELAFYGSPLGLYTIRSKDNNDYLGKIYLDVALSADGFSEIQYHILSEFKGKCYGTEAVNGILQFIKPYIGTKIVSILTPGPGIVKTELNAIVAKVHDTNLPFLKICFNSFILIEHIKGYDKKITERLFIFK